MSSASTTAPTTGKGRAISGEKAKLAIAISLLLAMLVAGLAGRYLLVIAALALLYSAIALGARRFATWPVLISVIILVILFVPARLVVFGFSFPIDPEPYRFLVMAAVFAWLAALLVDSGVRLEGTPFDKAIGAFAAAVLLSVVFNPVHVADFDTNVIKALSALMAVLVVYYLITSVIRSRREVDMLLGVLVAGTSIVAFLAVVEAATGENLFLKITSLPGLMAAPSIAQVVEDIGAEGGRGGYRRVLASAEHPLALGALFVMILPLSIWLVGPQQAVACRDSSARRGSTCDRFTHAGRDDGGGRDGLPGPQAADHRARAGRHRAARSGRPRRRCAEPPRHFLQDIPAAVRPHCGAVHRARVRRVGGRSAAR